MSILQLIAIAFSFVYIILAAKNDIRCFYAGIISSAAWGLEDFLFLNLKFDGFLQVFYLIMSFVGILQWRQRTGSENLSLSWFGLKNNIILIISGILLSYIFVEIMSNWTTSNSIWLDGITTVFSVLATFLLIKRIVDTWIYLLICDAIYIYIYGLQGAWLFVGMMVIYCVMAVVGYLNWRKMMAKT